MRRSPTDVDKALERWANKGLIDSRLADSLRAELDGFELHRERNSSQLAIAISAAIIFIIGTVTFLSAVWPQLGAPLRTAFIGVLGIALLMAGLRREARGWRRLAHIVQTCGIGAILLAYVYSQWAWPAGVVSRVIGAFSLFTPFVLFGITSRGKLLLCVITTTSYAFFGIALYKLFSLGFDSVVVLLDATYVATLVGLALLASQSTDETQVERRILAVYANLYVGFILVWATAIGPLDLADSAVLALDAWLILLTVLIVCIYHAGPSRIRRTWYIGQAPVSIGIGIVLAFWTNLRALEADALATAFTVVVIGALGLAYGLKVNNTPTVISGCAGVVTAAWYYAIARAELVGGVIALFFTAAVLFWISVHIGSRRQIM